jgi:NAD+ synthase
MTSRLEDALKLDLEAKAEELSHALREAVLQRLRRRGLGVAVSGGIDSACVAALAVRALGPERVFSLLLPERDSSPQSLTYGKALCEKLRISYEVKDIDPEAARHHLPARPLAPARKGRRAAKGRTRRIAGLIA